MITVFINSTYFTFNHKNLIFTQKFGFASTVFATADNESRAGHELQLVDISTARSSSAEQLTQFCKQSD
jgi:hypothetical protein